MPASTQMSRSTSQEEPWARHVVARLPGEARGVLLNEPAPVLPTQELRPASVVACTLVGLTTTTCGTLRNVPARDMTPRETDKYIEPLIVFLRRYTGTTMVLDGIDMWHHEMTVVDAKEGSVVANATTAIIVDVTTM